jgi:hypothetical protein
LGSNPHLEASMHAELDARYPIGRYQPPPEISADLRAEWIERIAATPAALREALRGMDDAALETPYRDGGWTVRQVTHHLPDSHVNAYVRFKLGLTEDTPTIKPYMEAAWAQLADTRETPVEVSLALLEALHHRWVTLLKSIPEEAWSRAVMHPENGVMRLDRLLGLYAWHGDHHVAHITGVRKRMGW